MPEKQVVFYFYTRTATFIQKDLAILKSEFEVLECAFPAPEKWKTPLLFLSQMGFLAQHILKWKRSVGMAQFGGYHTFIPAIWAKIFGRKMIIVVGGTDCVSFPSLRYGHFQNKLLAWFTRKSYQWSSIVSAVHKSLFYREDHYYLPEESKQGILHFVPAARFQKSEIPNGFDPQIFRTQTEFLNRNTLSFISIAASLDNPIRLKLKGIDMILDLANRMPEASFTLIGATNSSNISVPANVNLVSYAPNEELPLWYNRHRFYIQLSISEGFPNALCEAMACGCVPIVSEVASMPDIVGANGLIVQKRDLQTLFEAVQSFVKQEDTSLLSATCSHSIHARFGLEKRKNALTQIVSQIST